jgi:hypothetical protein
MKCIQCKNGKLRLVKHDVKKWVYSSAKKENAILQCDTCGHKEVF